MYIRTYMHPHTHTHTHTHTQCYLHACTYVRTYIKLDISVSCRNDRITVKEREKLEEAAAKMEDNQKKLLEERKKESLRVRDSVQCTGNILRYNLVSVYSMYVCM